MPPSKTKRHYKFMHVTALIAFAILLGLSLSNIHSQQELVLLKLSFQDDLPTTHRNLQQKQTSLSTHNPQQFTHNLQLNINRGLNIINCWSGQTISSWIYAGEASVDGKFVTWNNEHESKFLTTNASQILPNDTIFVAFVKLKEFVHQFLPQIQNDFVLITESWHLLYPDWIPQVSSQIVNHPHLLHWFSNNIANYTGGQQYHPKVTPFPLGLKPRMPGAKQGTYRYPIPSFREAFLETLHNNLNKTQKIFVGYMRPTHERRKHLPNGKNLDYPHYLRALANAEYVLSPNGDHPDCHRHYEALGMGAIPITELDPFLYRHLQGGPVIFNNTNWDLRSLENELSANTLTPVNRNIVFEEYWMEFVERTVGRPLRWWDLVQQKKAYLHDFATTESHVEQQKQ